MSPSKSPICLTPSVSVCVSACVMASGMMVSDLISQLVLAGTVWGFDVGGDVHMESGKSRHEVEAHSND